MCTGQLAHSLCTHHGLRVGNGECRGPSDTSPTHTHIDAHRLLCTSRHEQTVLEARWALHQAEPSRDSAHLMIISRNNHHGGLATQSTIAMCTCHQTYVSDMCKYTYAHTYIRTYISNSFAATCTHADEHTCRQMCMFLKAVIIGMYTICAYVDMYTCMMCVPGKVRAHAHICACMLTKTQACTHMHVGICRHVCSHMGTGAYPEQVCAQTHTLHTCSNVCEQADVTR